MLEKIEARLVDGWRSAWRWWSVQMHLIASAVLMLAQLAPVMPPEVQKVIPQPWGAIITALWTLLGLYARLVKQKEKPNG